MELGSACFTEGGWSPKKPPAGHGPPQANLGVIALPPTPLVDVPYYIVNGLDAMRLATVRPDMTTAEVEALLIRAVIFTVYCANPRQAAATAGFMARSNGWAPEMTSPRVVEGEYGPQSFAAVTRRPATPQTLDKAIQAVTAFRTTLFTGPVPGWQLVWDRLGNPYKPCGLVYGCRGTAIGAPCGRETGCQYTDPPGGPCLWARQGLRENAVERPEARLFPDDPRTTAAPPSLPPPPALRQPWPGGLEAFVPGAVAHVRHRALPPPTANVLVRPRLAGAATIVGRRDGYAEVGVPAGAPADPWAPQHLWAPSGTPGLPPIPGARPEPAPVAAVPATGADVEVPTPPPVPEDPPWMRW